MGAMWSNGGKYMGEVVELEQSLLREVNIVGRQHSA